MRDAGVESARVDAELLLAHVLDIGRGRLLLIGDVSASDEAVYRSLVARRVEREPLQHLTGHAPFRRLLLAVGPGVFVPRPETELLVDAAIAGVCANPVVVDLCSGSGAIALAIADEVPGASVYAVENSTAALRYLRQNCATSGVQVVEGDVGDHRLLGRLDGAVDLVISNPPYVPSGAEISPEARRDPAVAVFGGVDGLDVVRQVVRVASRLLRPGGLFVVEHDDGGSGAVAAHSLRRDGWVSVCELRDLTGRPRYLTARRPGEFASPPGGWGRMAG